MSTQTNQSGRSRNLIRNPKQAILAVIFVTGIGVALKYSLFGDDATTTIIDPTTQTEVEVPAGAYGITAASWADDDAKVDGFVAPPGGTRQDNQPTRPLTAIDTRDKEAAERWQNLDIYRRNY